LETHLEIELRFTSARANQLIKSPFSYNIEHMSDLFFDIAQFILTLWPLILITVLIYSLIGSEPTRRSRRGWLRTLQLRTLALLRRMRRNLLLSWVVLFAIWLVTLFAAGPTPTLLPEPWNTVLFFGLPVLLLAGELTRLKGLFARLHAHAAWQRAAAIRDLKRMDPYDFEILIGETYRAYGFRVRHVGQSGDHGVDVEMRGSNGDTWVVQCKRYRDSVGESVVRDLYGTLISEGADRAALVTTAEITQPAREWARGKPIDLVDGPALLRLIAGARRLNEGTWFDRLALTLDRWFAPAPRPSGLQSAGAPTASAQPAPNGAAAVYRAPARPAVSPASVVSPTPVARPVPIQPAFPAAVAAAATAAATVPAGRIRYTREGVPICPRCGLVMTLHPSSQREMAESPVHRRPLYRCPNSPTCRVVLEHRPSAKTAEPEA
jgi:restriction system protein